MGSETSAPAVVITIIEAVETKGMCGNGGCGRRHMTYIVQHLEFLFVL